MADTPQTPSGAPTAPPTRIVIKVVVTQLVLAALVGVAFVVLYAGLQRDPQPYHLPVAVVGESQAADVQQTLGSTIRVVEVPDSGAARDAVAHRTAVASFELTAHSVQISLAGPNGLAENTAAQALGDGFARTRNVTTTTTDLMPLPPYDPRGLAGFYTILGVTVGSFIFAQALYALRTLAGLRAQLLATAGFAVFIAITVVLLVGPLLHLLPGSPWGLLPVLMLQSLAVSLTTRALTAWFNSYGIIAATLAMTAVGLSTSGGIIGQDLLPEPLGLLGALLPPGAAFRAVVDITYFGGAQLVLPVLTLTIWLLVALGALLTHYARSRRPMSSTTVGVKSVG
jgi:hypothetical protein